MGVSGLAVCSALLRYLPDIGYRIPLFLRDRRADATLPQELKNRPHVFFYTGEGWDKDVRESVLFRSPGIRPDILAFEQAKAMGKILTSEMSWFFAKCPSPVYAITGSDGKTTTSTMTASVLSAWRQAHTYLGGNIGISLLPMLDRLTVHDRVVLELSSFQLWDIAPKTDASAILNISENHLDMHQDMAEYIETKSHILTHAKRRVLWDDCPHYLDFLRQEDTLCSFSHPLSYLQKTYPCHSFVWRAGERLYYTEGRATHTLFSTHDMYVGGMHNIKNAMTVIGLLGGVVTKEALFRGICHFRGVPHRMQYVGEFQGVRCYDSAIDTTPARVHATLSSFEGKSTVICGGSDKGLSYDPLAKTLLEFADLVVLSGATAPKILKAIAQFPAPQKPPVYHVENFGEAVTYALSHTPKGGRLILSPGSASFDQFASYKQKGDAFLAYLAKYTKE
ncbi:MAG: UDP-N-acetylmuramoyl-L-alanine--D-glutamate ligase [Clostridia bacterium]|nr:UDP-N-acetylmuramoyl-L-alanine--D-glutamate ligase [Clostridia bacterium]